MFRISKQKSDTQDLADTSGPTMAIINPNAICCSRVWSTPALNCNILKKCEMSWKMKDWHRTALKFMEEIDSEISSIWSYQSFLYDPGAIVLNLILCFNTLSFLSLFCLQNHNAYKAKSLIFYIAKRVDPEESCHFYQIHLEYN